VKLGAETEGGGRHMGSAPRATFYGDVTCLFHQSWEN